MFHATQYESNELFHRATHDTLTGLANRALFFDRLRQRIAQAQRNSEGFGILNLDMDGLKQINDQFGHRAGDAAIKELAARIKAASRQADTVARVGGDEFGVILFHIGNREGVKLASGRLAQRIDKPFEFEQHVLRLSASIGSAVFPEDGMEMNALLEKADQAMYEVKRMRKGDQKR
jgi:diguanylate cyclase (GGDEF)-like protein